MIKVEKLEIHEFRGIRKLNLELAGENFAVCGPNGTGKSGIVDALEFALTGNISRLSGRGAGELSLKKHAPHVDSQNNPEKARVILTATIPSLKKRVTIERSVKNPEQPIVTPADTDVLNVIRQVETHPEFALSRRELIRYVLSAPGDRAKEVQILLRLHEVEDLRMCLQKIANACERNLNPLKRQKDLDRDQLIKALAVPGLTAQQILKATNQRRTLLGLAPLDTLTPTTSLKDGLATASAAKGPVKKIPKVQATSDIAQLRKSIATLSDAKVKSLCDTLKIELVGLQKEPAILNSVTREKLLSTALSLIEDETCPVCDTEWESGQLTQLVKEKLHHLEKVAKNRKSIEDRFENLIAPLVEAKQILMTVFRYGLAATPIIDTSALRQHADDLDFCKQNLEAFLPIDKTISSLDFITTIPPVLTEQLNALAKLVESIPEPTKQDAARDYLTIGQDRLETFRETSRRLKEAENQAALSKKVSDIYADVSTKVLDAIYKQVETEFRDLYRFINREDEEGFDAHLTPSFGRLGFDVDFYGRGFFPPGAYHSEGHQDAMGLCLYLALMKHLLGAAFTFSVLDDVLMSVDAGHRREVCKLLKDRFPNTQFVLTTHDHIWLQHMKSEGLIKSTSAIRFRKWNVDQGPSEWQDRDVWTEIEGSVENNEIRQAAGLLRHYLEYISAEICHSLRARVEFRADAQFQLGDLLPAAIAKFKKLLKHGKVAAQSWGQQPEFEALDAREKKFCEIVAASNVENWQINPAIHFNQWASFVKEDFLPVVSSHKDLIDALRCKKCGTFYQVIPERGNLKSVECACGSNRVNLQAK
jgi:recombinational DNA repair ATPase RecF